MGIWVKKTGQILAFCLMILAGVFSGCGEAWSLSRADLQKVFAKPLIIGASVSASILAPSPGNVATKLVNNVDNAVNIAVGGAEGRWFRNITPESLSEYSVIIGVDYFFWDSALEDPSQSLRALKNAIRSAKVAKVPLVLGDIPQLVDEQKPNTRALLNQRIHADCLQKNNCYVLEIDKLHRLAETEGIVIGGRRYRFSELTYDGLHTNTIANDYMARIILQLLAQ